MAASRITSRPRAKAARLNLAQELLVFEALDMGQACLRSTSLDQAPLEVIGEMIASIPMDTYIEYYRASRKKTAKGAT